MSMAGNAGAYLVDYIPFRACDLFFCGPQNQRLPTLVKHVPSWFPGATFKRQAAEWRKATTAMVEVPFKAVRSAMVSRLPNSRRRELGAVLSPRNETRPGRGQGRPVDDHVAPARPWRGPGQAAPRKHHQWRRCRSLHRYALTPTLRVVRSALECASIMILFAGGSDTVIPSRFSRSNINSPPAPDGLGHRLVFPRHAAPPGRAAQGTGGSRPSRRERSSSRLL